MLKEKESGGEVRGVDRRRRGEGEGGGDEGEGEGEGDEEVWGT